MTILEKQGPSTAPGDDVELDTQASEKHGLDPASVPPSYADTMGASGSRSRAPTANYISLREHHGSINGTWAIDTSLQVPPALLRPLESEKAVRENLALHVTHGSIHADVSLVSGAAQRANIDVGAHHGKVVFRLTSRANMQSFKLKAKSHHGGVTVAIPHDFVGPLRCRRHHSKIKISPALLSGIIQFQDDLFFVGDWQTAGFTDFDQWQGDEVEIEVTHGHIDIAYADDVHGVEVPIEKGPRVEDAGAKLKKRGGFFTRRRDHHC